MTQKKRITHITTILFILTLTLCCLCSITTATQLLPQDPTNPHNNYTILSPNPYNAYTEHFLQRHPNNKDPSIEFGGHFYFNDPLDLRVNEKTLFHIYRYIAANNEYLAQNPNSKITIKMDDCNPIDVATSYTDRDPLSIYPDDIRISPNPNRDPRKPKPENEITVYMHEGNLQKYSYQIHHNDLINFEISNPKYPKVRINPIFGQNQINSYSTYFLTTQHYIEKTTQKDEYTYYITKPNLSTILDYIVTQSPQLLNKPNSKIYLNLKDQGLFLNRELIAYSKKLQSNEIKPPYQNPIDTIITYKNDLPKKLLIAKTPGTDNQIGVFIDLETLNQLEPDISSYFKWISTYNCNRDGSRFCESFTGWSDTIYEPI